MSENLMKLKKLQRHRNKLKLLIHKSKKKKITHGNNFGIENNLIIKGQCS